ncbi:VRR-NUC domain-containing protein [uncultured Vibrio sp.]|uniref:VRR-NUC domain-containing protein n=1 Tax=uncultured Vibrio sp. TaxID=114054 RepID=UPI0025CC2DBB|nr:VRR-NUC domain-containing protein [uncultured Vibrio sp.]
MQSPPILATDYYLTNFHKLTRHAILWYSDLLTENEKQRIEAIEQLPHAAQCLLVRLYSRKGKWFRSDKLNYEEIPDIDSALEALVEAKFVAVNATISEQEISESLLTKNEVLSLYPKSDKKLRKVELVNQLSSSPFSRFNELSFECIHLLNNELCEVLLGLFFANTYQDLSQFVLEDIGVHQFESYSLNKNTRYFKRRQDVDQLIQLGRLRNDYDSISLKDIKQLTLLLESIGENSEHSSIAKKQQKFINVLARDLERFDCFSDALTWFKRSDLPPSRERQARIYDKLNDVSNMEMVVESMRSSPFDESELEVATKLSTRLERMKGNKVPKTAKPTVPEQHLTLDLSSQRVELAVQRHLNQEWDSIYYLENQFLTGLFGLHFWDVIFADIDGAFVNPYQHKPLDLYHHDFATKRQQLIDERFSHLESNGYATIIANFESKLGLANPFVHWPSMSIELIESAQNAISASRLNSLFKVMLSDLALYRNGMPDLIAFRGSQFEWIEVKGPGDKLQDNQWRWIKRFQELAIPFSVCYVKDSNS